MFWTLGFWQSVAALAAFAHDHAVPVARPTAGRALQRQGRLPSGGWAENGDLKSSQSRPERPKAAEFL